MSEPQTKSKRGCAGIFFFFMVVVAAVWGAALGVFVSILDDARDTITTLEDFRPKIGSKVYSADGDLLAEFSIEERQLLPLNQIPLHVQKAFIATEDHPFYEHKGVRPDAILRAAVRTMQTGDRQGGSTITQQVVRNVDDLLIGKEVSIQRKLREAIVALQVEREFTKDEILELYLNQIFLGISAYGVEAASLQYFDKSSEDVTLGEAAMLAGLTRAPNVQEPLNNFDNALRRRGIVLDQMLERGFITVEEHQAANAENLAESVVTLEERRQRRLEDQLWRPKKFKAPYFVEEVRRFLFQQYDKEEVLEGGLDIETTVDMRLQEAAERALLAGLEAFDESKLKSLRARNREDEFVPVTGALVCIDNRPEYRGFVRAMVGGRDFDVQKFNNATQAYRQCGSSVKPFVWAAALADGRMTPSTMIADAPFSKIGTNGKVWNPGNFDGKYRGMMPIRLALEKSVNTVSLRIAERVGIPYVKSYLQSCGYQRPIDPSSGLTIALGTPEVTPLQQATAYSVFPNGGVRHDPVLVTRIRNRDGIATYDYKDHARHEQAMKEDVAFVVAHLLKAAAEYGTGARTAPLERPRAGKTGTTNDSRDVWFCGFTPDFTTVVWVGYANNASLGSTNDFTGGRLAAPIWTEFMLAAQEGLPKKEFEPPFGVEFFNIDRQTGYLGGNYREAYIKGTGPTARPAAPRPSPAEAPGFAAPTAEASPRLQLIEPL